MRSVDGVLGLPPGPRQFRTAGPTFARAANGEQPDKRTRREEGAVIVLGVILLVIGFVAKISVLWTVGIIVLAVGAVLLLLGSAGHAVRGRRHYW
ncbi:DUF6131 family protein [Streptacidiphilus sp. MAP12-20]|uniref:DUF6131 family protein n=1 Tax=Streptacidiphilus sp. MAP12-20 TaxID=3156299 RepID=UPI003513A34D